MYSLPNGKVIFLTIEEYLSLTDEDIQILIASNRGEQPNNPFYGSIIKSSNKSSSKDDNDFYNKDGLDIEEESEEFYNENKIDLDNLPDSLNLDNLS